MTVFRAKTTAVGINRHNAKRSSENVFQTTFCNRSKLLLINTSIVFQPAVGMAACGVVVRPMEDAALFRPFVFAVEADFIAFFQALDFVGEVDVVRH